MDRAQIPLPLAKKIDIWCAETFSDVSREYPLRVALRSIFYQGFQLGCTAAQWGEADMLPAIEAPREE